MSRREVRANRADAQESVHEVECFLCLRIKVLNHGAGELVRVILLEIDYLLEDIDIDRLLGGGGKRSVGSAWERRRTYRGRRGVVGRVMSLGGVVVVVIVIVIAGGV